MTPLSLLRLILSMYTVNIINIFVVVVDGQSTDDVPPVCQSWLESVSGPPPYGGFDTLPAYMFDEDFRSCECQLIDGTVDSYKGTCTTCSVCSANGVCGVGETQVILAGMDRTVSIIDTIEYTDGVVDGGYFFFEFSREVDQNGVERPVCTANYDLIECNICEYRPCDVADAGLALYMDCSNIPEVGEIRDRCVEDYASSAPHNGIFSLVNDDAFCTNSAGEQESGTTSSSDGAGGSLSPATPDDPETTTTPASSPTSAAFRKDSGSFIVFGKVLLCIVAMISY